MRKHPMLIIASAFVAASASTAFAAPSINNEGGTPMHRTSVAYSAAKHGRVLTPRPFEQVDPWQQARTDDANEARGD
jgi:hypothetical protein